MSEDESRRLDHEEEQDEVEAHRRTLAANEETKDDDGDDDVEAHRRVNV